MKFVKSVSRPSGEPLILVVDGVKYKKHELLGKAENDAVRDAVEKKRPFIEFNSGEELKLVMPLYGEKGWEQSEKARRVGASFCNILNGYGKLTTCIVCEDAGIGLAIAEGIGLANYQFLKYKSDVKKVTNSLDSVALAGKQYTATEIKYLNTVLESTYIARDLVNEPQSYLNALQLSEEFKKMGEDAGFSVEVWNEGKIESQKMGGLLAVNKGSKIPPTFTIMTYKPSGAVNKKPFVLVGKGVVYDTGGLSLKSTPANMDFMKSDMAGSAVVAGAMYAIAKLGLPLHVVGLVPATDNWIGEDSYAPGDVITMYSGATVEVMNTDAEGRLILADALHFAGKLEPQLVCDFATLTGAAVNAIGTYASAVMGTAGDEVKQEIFDSSYAVFERLVEFPLWEEYGDELKSDIADMTNLGKSQGGQISAGKFLQHFTDYPWLHFDIAGPSFNHAQDSYKPRGGTGVGVRLMVDFLYKQSTRKTRKQK